MRKRALVLFIMLFWMFFILSWGSFDLPKIKYITYIQFPNLTVEHIFMLVYFGVAMLLALSLAFEFRKVKEVIKIGRKPNSLPFYTRK